MPPETSAPDGTATGPVAPDGRLHNWLPGTARSRGVLTALLLALLVGLPGCVWINRYSSNPTPGNGEPPPRGANPGQPGAGNAGHTASVGRPQPLPLASPTKAVWVSRFHYRTPDDIEAIMRNCRQLGFNTVLWQVRGEGTVAYPSRIEPWSSEYGFRDPGFDPLRIAIAEAHRNKLRIEAWVNVMPGWQGPKPPPIANQLYNSHPEWFLYDARGRRQPLTIVNPETKKSEGFYAVLNPCYPEVRRYLAGIFDELLQNYDVDGLHLDYIRYAWDGTPNARNLFPRDPRTIAMFRQQTGLDPDSDRSAWDAWRANQLTRIVVDARDILNRARRGASLTAAVRPDPDQAYRDHLQNAVAWLRSGLIDAAMPMAYTERVDLFEANILAYRQSAPGKRIVPGVGAYKLETEKGLESQLARCQSWGGDVAIYSYDDVFAPGRARGSGRAEDLREMRRAAIAGHGFPSQ